MDLERIKQNLRLRSGRSKKQSKKPPAPKWTATSQDTQADSRRPVAQTNGYSPAPSTPEPSTVRPSSRSNVNGAETDSAPEEQRVESESEPQPPQAVAEKNLVNPVEPGSGEQQEQENASNLDGRGTLDGSTSQEPRPQTPSTTMADQYTLDVGVNNNSESEDYDLRPPAPKPKPPSIESMSELLFSPGHLNALIHDPLLVTKFTTFLRKYRPQDYPLLTRYLEVSKAIKAVDYANAVAESTAILPQATGGHETETSRVAAVLDASFKEACSSAFNTLLNTSLPLYITYLLIRAVSECLIDEITGRSTTLMNEMIGGLSEVFCLSDPSQSDNPIVYASEEFYRLTGYRQEDSLGQNCRFLQGSKTNRQSVGRLRESIDRGEEIYETLLNYRRNGRPFVNMLMIAPLHDNQGVVKYQLGAQVDVTPLIGSGRVLEGFQKFLLKREAEQNREAKQNHVREDSEKDTKKKALDRLRELSELFDLEESAIVRSSSRSSSVERESDVRSIGNGSARRRFVESEASEDEEDGDLASGREAWRLGQEGPLGVSGKLPGVYEKYMLIRPAPSLRIVFVSPKLRKFGTIVQSPFLSHVAAPAGTLSGLVESFKSGIPVTAKINFMPKRGEHRKGTTISPNSRHEDGKYGRACWMSATPLLGGDDQIGVWMIVFVEKAQAKAQQARKRQSQDINLQNQRASELSQTQQPDRTLKQRTPGPPDTNQKPPGEEGSYTLPIKPKRLEEPIHFTPQRQSVQSEVPAYQYQAATPVEEYHSAGEDEDPDSSLKPAPRAEIPPHTPKDETTSEDEFVRLTETDPRGLPPPRLVISPDSERGRPVSKGKRSRDELDRTRSPDEDSPQDPNIIPPSLPSDRASLPDDEVEPNFDDAAPTRSASPGKNQEIGSSSAETTQKSKSTEQSSAESQSTPTPPQRSLSPELKTASQSAKTYKTQTSKSGATLTGSFSYMDYLRHQGSNRPAPGSLNKEGDKSAHGTMEEPCVSPYSVD